MTDAGPPDDSLAIARALAVQLARPGLRIRVLAQPKNGGKSKALNRGLAERRQALGVTVDGDSYLRADALRKLAKAGRGHQLVHLFLRTAAHHPCLPGARAGQGARGVAGAGVGRVRGHHGQVDHLVAQRAVAGREVVARRAGHGGAVRADGQHLYPAMPYTAYALASDEDAQALYAYFMQGVAPVDAAPAQATALAARRTLAQLAANRQANAVALIQAQGGGWQVSWVPPQ